MKQYSKILLLAGLCVGLVGCQTYTPSCKKCPVIAPYSTTSTQCTGGCPIVSSYSTKPVRHVPVLACCKNSYYNQGANNSYACQYHRCFNVGCCSSTWR